MTDPIAVMQRFIHEFQTAGNATVADELLAPDFIDHTPFPGFGSSRDDVMALFQAMRGAFPDLRAEIDEQFLDGDGERVVSRKTFHGTHKGPFAGIPATGKSVAIRVVDIVRVRGGLMREHWNVVDFAGLIAQLQG